MALPSRSRCASSGVFTPGASGRGGAGRIAASGRGVSTMAKSSTTVSTVSTVSTPAPAPASCKADTARADLTVILAALTPASALRASGLPAVKPAERVAARRAVVHAWADLDSGRSCPLASFAVRLSDGSTLPFRLWAERVLSIREGGTAYAVSVA